MKKRELIHKGVEKDTYLIKEYPKSFSILMTKKEIDMYVKIIFNESIKYLSKLDSINGSDSAKYFKERMNISIDNRSKLNGKFIAVGIYDNYTGLYNYTGKDIILNGKFIKSIIEYNKLTGKNYNYIYLDVLYHELIHYYCWYTAEDKTDRTNWCDGSYRFEKLLSDLGVKSSGRTNSNKVIGKKGDLSVYLGLTLECKNCGKKYIKYLNNNYKGYEDKRFSCNCGYTGKFNIKKGLFEQIRRENK